ncbi:MAG TPA: NAD kinase [Methylophilaceae bacterium]
MKSAFKNIALVGKFMNAETGEHVSALARFLTERNYSVVIEEGTAQQSRLTGYPVAALERIGSQVDLAVVVGGDGTMLTAARAFVRHRVPLVGVNRGRFGFLTDLEAENMLEGIASILAGEYDRDERMLLHGELQREGRLVTQGHALNDVVINKNGAAKLIELEVHINGQFVHTQRSDGLIIATPTGTTAYSLSAGGPILHPGLDAIALVPICPHTLSNRPIAIHGDSCIEVTLVRAEDACVHFDGQLHSALQEGDRMVIRRAQEAITLLHPRGHSHFAMLREKLNWG